MRGRLAPVLFLVAVLGSSASATEAPPTPQPTSALLGEGCSLDGTLRGAEILPALRPCGVHVAPDGTTSMVPVAGGIGLPQREDAAAGWSRLARPAPERRVTAALAELPGVGVVMYGGLTCPGWVCAPVAETWVWEGETWRRLQTPASPPPLHAAAMTYDAARRELVLFGGETCTTEDCSFSSETWTFDGTTWERHDVVVTPPPSAASAMAFDPDSARVVLSGGCSLDRCPGPVGTWSWDGSAWALEDLLTPTPRVGATMATDPAGGVVLFGGVDLTGNSLAETWRWEGEWTQLQPAASPPSRTYGGMTFDHEQDRVIVFAGSTVTCSLSCTGGYLHDTWTWDGTTWTERPSEPLPRGGQSLTIAYDAERDEVIRFGGISTFPNWMGSTTAAYESSTWLWDGSVWREKRSPMPEERVQPALGYHPGAEVVVLTGGNCVYTTTCDTWAFDGQTWTRIGGVAPAPNARASLIPDTASDSLLFPVATGVWRLDHDEEEDRWSWSRAEASDAPVLGGFATAGDRTGGVLLFGAQACSPCTYLDQTWRWDGTSWQERTPAAKPPGRAFSMMAFDPESEDTVLFGGLTNGGQLYFDDTWMWDGETWRQAAGAGPPSRAFTRLAHDPATGDVMVVGGIGGAADHPVLGDQWLFDGSSWRQVSAAGPAHRIEHGVAGFPATATTVLFGGQDENPGRPMSDTWIWSG